MIKAVFFDIDNTLYSYDRGNEAGMKALTVTEKRFFRWIGRHL